jgi:hypothetical protein
MVGELDVCIGVHVVLRRDFVWMYFVKRDGNLGDACDESLNFMKTCLQV